MLKIATNITIILLTIISGRFIGFKLWDLVLEKPFNKIYNKYKDRNK